MKRTSLDDFYWIYLIKQSMKVSFSHPKRALFEVILMLVSRFFLFSIWFVFFNFYKDVNGWALKEVAILLGVIAGAYGILQIFFGGFYQIPRLILDGELDCYLIQPRNPLWSIILSKSMLKGWGDIVYMIFLIPLGGIFSLKALSLLILAVVCSCLVCLSANLIVMSLGFWFSSGKNLSQKYYLTLLIFCSYPTNIYTGFSKAVFFTLIPAGVMGFLPVELIKNFSWEIMVILISLTILFLILSNKFFLLGLRRYISGSLIKLR